MAINKCQNKISTNQYHMTILWAKVLSSRRSLALFKLAADQVRFSIG